MLEELCYMTSGSPTPSAPKGGVARTMSELGGKKWGRKDQGHKRFGSICHVFPHQALL
ncbi:hypothetical protein FRB95_002586 [Tulasnella sp. JGI-2019a]|nr:hypothetical protein FRB95_002586 [Tulasnella sp. JGI-2019a]